MPKSDNQQDLEELGEKYHALRQAILVRGGIGLTQAYNSFHDPLETDPSIESLRQLHVELDRSVMRAFGWKDIELNHGFYSVPYLPENDNLRFTISEDARLNVLMKLAALNNARYEEEVNQGLHGKQKDAKRKSKSLRSKDATHAQLHFGNVDSGIIGESD